jgi:hypothetical protein
MNRKAPTPHDWQLFHRLEAVGCPLDLAHLPPPDYPLRVIPLSGLQSNFLALKERWGLVLDLRMIARAPITIAHYRVEAAWLASPVTWLEPCLLHPGHYCFEIAEKHHRHYSPALNGRTFARGKLRSGEYLHGVLTGIITQPPLVNGADLPATLWIGDVTGREYPYLLSCHTAASEFSITGEAT